MISKVRQVQHVSLPNDLFFSRMFIILAPNCSTTIRRLLLRFNYSSITNIISSADVYVLTDSSASSSARITIQWNDLGDTAAANTTVPRGYNDDEALQFRRNGNSSYVASLVPSRFFLLFFSKTFSNNEPLSLLRFKWILY